MLSCHYHWQRTRNWIHIENKLSTLTIECWSTAWQTHTMLSINSSTAKSAHSDACKNERHNKCTYLQFAGNQTELQVTFTTHTKVLLWRLNFNLPNGQYKSISSATSQVFNDTSTSSEMCMAKRLLLPICTPSWNNPPTPTATDSYLRYSLAMTAWLTRTQKTSWHTTQPWDGHGGTP